MYNWREEIYLYIYKKREGERRENKSNKNEILRISDSG